MASWNGKTHRAFANAPANGYEQSRVQHRTASLTTASAPEQSDQDFTTLHALAHSQDVSKLENAVDLGKAILPGFAGCLLEAVPDDFVKEKLAMVSDLSKVSNKQYTLGIAGPTGHGKSSLINALLDEDELVPTSSYQACTAVAIEISWNDMTTTSQNYIALVEFVKLCDWHLELKKLVADLRALDNGDHEDNNETRLARDKIRAVEPYFDFERLEESLLIALGNGLHQDFWGTTREEEASSASELLEKMSPYFESEPLISDDVSTDACMALWPLIKVVRIKTRAEFLSTGLVLVDLPGVADANTARGNVAADYLKKCDGVWIVADITRAADDRPAHNLLGTHFRQQMRLDGNYGNITMVCTKADNLNVDRDGRGFDYPEAKALYAKARSAARAWTTRSRRPIDSMTARANAPRDILDEVLKRRQTYEIKSETARSEFIPVGKRKAAPTHSVGAEKKRAHYATTVRRQTSNNASDDDDRSYRSPQDVWYQLESGPDGQSPTANSFTTSRNTFIDHLDYIESLAREESDSISEELIQKQQLDLNCQQSRSKLKSLYMGDRNRKAVTGVREQFNSGLKEMDGPLAQERALFRVDLESRERHYKAISDSLPVFCVSSTAYQDFLDPLHGQPEGFEDREATQIPQLRRHAVTLTKKGRIRHCQQFLNKLIELLNSLRMWESAEKSQDALAFEHRQKWQASKQSNVEILTRRLLNTADIFVTQCEGLFEDRLFPNMDISLQSADSMALGAASRWSSLHHMTYSAVCRRGGEFSNHKGVHDFNEDLISPFKSRISSDWEQAFVRFIPNYLDALQKEAAKAQNDFHEGIKKTFPRSVPQEVVDRLRAQLQTRKRQLDFTAQALVDNLTRYHREANRQFKPPIQQNMEYIYSKAAQQSGRGYFDRMKRILSNDISRTKGIMFLTVGQKIRQQLNTLQADLKNDIVAQIKDTLKSIDHDYSISIAGGERTYKEAAKDAATRKRMRSLLGKVEEYFREA